MKQKSILALTLLAGIVSVGCKDDQHSGEPSDLGDPTWTGHVVIDTAVVLDNTPFGVAVSTAGVAYVTRLGNASIARLSPTTGELVEDSIAVGSVPTGIAFAPNGAKAYVASQGGTLDVVDVTSNTMIHQTTFAGSGFNTAVQPDGAAIYVGTNILKVYVVDATTNGIVDSLAAGGSPNGFAFPSTGGTLWYSDAVAGDLRHAPLPAHSPLSITPHGGSFQTIVFSSDNATGYVVNETAGMLFTFDPSTGAVTDSLLIPGNLPFGLARRPGSTLLWVTTLNGWIVVVDPVANVVVDSMHAGGRLRRIAFDPVTTRAVIADEYDRVLIAH
jgi:DNA-binding beta-propeller fold protein YncE